MALIGLNIFIRKKEAILLFQFRIEKGMIHQGLFIALQRRRANGFFYSTRNVENHIVD